MDLEELRECSLVVGTSLFDFSSESRLLTWSDDNLKELKSGVKFRKSACDLVEVKMILCRFFNFYFHGVVKIEDCIGTILADVIANSSTLDNDIWPNDVFSDEPSFKKNLSDVKDLFGDAVKSLVRPVVSNSNRNAAEKAAYEELITEYTTDEGNKFKELIAAEIRNMDPNKLETEEAKRIKRLASFLALTLWRAVTKNKYQLHIAFFEKQYRSDLHVIAGWQKELPFYPPCSECIQACVELLPNTTATTNMFILLVSEYVSCIQHELHKDQSKVKFLHTSVLKHTAKHGLGILRSHI